MFRVSTKCFLTWTGRTNPAVWLTTQKASSNKPNFPQPTSASALRAVPTVLENQTFQIVSWLCCISRHFVRSAADTCTAKHLQPSCSCITPTSFHSSVPEEETPPNHVILWPLLLFSNSAALWWLKLCTLCRLSPWLAPESRKIQCNHKEFCGDFKGLAQHQS